MGWSAKSKARLALATSREVSNNTRTYLVHVSTILPKRREGVLVFMNDEDADATMKVATIASVYVAQHAGRRHGGAHGTSSTVAGREQ